MNYIQKYYSITLMKEKIYMYIRCFKCLVSICIDAVTGELICLNNLRFPNTK